MQHLVKRLWTDEAGFLISAELVIVATITILGVIVGLSCVASAVNAELRDFSWAMQSLNQSYFISAFRGCWKWSGPTSWVAGSAFYDTPNNFGYGYGFGGPSEIGFAGRPGRGMQVQQYDHTLPCPTGECLPTDACPPGVECPPETTLSDPTPAEHTPMIVPTAPPCDACEVPQD